MDFWVGRHSDFNIRNVHILQRGNSQLSTITCCIWDCTAWQPTSSDHFVLIMYAKTQTAWQTFIRGFWIPMRQTVNLCNYSLSNSTTVKDKIQLKPGNSWKDGKFQKYQRMLLLTVNDDHSFTHTEVLLLTSDMVIHLGKTYRLNFVSFFDLV